NGWGPRDKLAHLRMCLTGAAAQILTGDSQGWETAEPLIAKLQQRFGVEGQAPIYRSQLRNRRRKKGETISELYEDVYKMFLLAYPGKVTDQGNAIKTSCTHLHIAPIWFH